MMALWLFLRIASAGQHLISRPGETLTTIAAELGDPTLAGRLQELNDFPLDIPLPTGTIIRLPEQRGPCAEQTGLLTRVSGSGTLRGPDGTTLRLQEGLRIGPGTTICTDPESFVSLRLATTPSGTGTSAAHDDLSLLPNTCLTLLEAAADIDSRASLVGMSEGSVAVTPTYADGGRVTVQTPNAVATGEEGGFRVTVETDGATRAESMGGNVRLSAGGAEVVLAPGEGARATVGEAPSAARMLLREANLLGPEDGAPLRRTDFHWSPVDRALGYRVQVAATPQFDELVHQTEVALPRWQPDLLLLPTDLQVLYWRVTALDRFGFEGQPSSAWRIALPGEGPSNP
jgi:hypothetical protein